MLNYLGVLYLGNVFRNSDSHHQELRKWLPPSEPILGCLFCCCFVFSWGRRRWKGRGHGERRERLGVCAPWRESALGCFLPNNCIHFLLDSFLPSSFFSVNAITKNFGHLGLFPPLLCPITKFRSFCFYNFKIF